MGDGLADTGSRTRNESRLARQVEEHHSSFTICTGRPAGGTSEIIRRSAANPHRRFGHEIGEAFVRFASGLTRGYDLILLAALLRGPAYGYALKKTAGFIFGGSALHNNVVYPSLKKFMRNGWVQQTAVPGERGQQRKQYRITRAGRQQLLAQLGSFGDREAAVALDRLQADGR